MALDRMFEEALAAHISAADHTADEARAREAFERATAWAMDRTDRTYDQMFPPTAKED